jgi:hypothetical protein
MALRTHGRRTQDGGDGRNVREHRLQQYANPASRTHAHGQSTQQNLDQWSARASKHSEQSERAAGTRANNGSLKPGGDPPAVHSTGPKVTLHDTSAPPRTNPDTDAAMVDHTSIFKG